MQPLSLLIPGFAGDARGENVFTLPDLYSPGGSVNFYLDKRGRLRVLPGWTRFANPITTANGASGKINSIQPFRPASLAVGSTSYMLFTLDNGLGGGSAQWELWVSTDAGLVNRTRLITFGSTSIGKLASFATLGADLYITNGAMTPQSYDGATLTPLTTAQLGAPAVATVVGGTGDTGAGPLNGSYRYRLVPVRANKARKIGSVVSNTYQAQNTRARITWVADADGTVIGYELYRTSGTGMDYYLVAYIDGRVTAAYTDALPDSVLITRTALAVVASHGDPPPLAHFVVAHKQRIWWMRTDALPRTVYPSDPNDGDSVYQDAGGMTLTDAGESSQGDILVGGHGEFNDALICWMRYSIWLITGTGKYNGNVVDWRPKRSDASIGTVHARAAIKVPAGAKYRDAHGAMQEVRANAYAYLTPMQDIRLFDGNTDTIIDHDARGMIAFNGADGGKSYAWHDERRGMLIWGVPNGNLGETVNTFVAWNYWFGTWHKFDGCIFGHVGIVEQPSEGLPFWPIAGNAHTTAGGGWLYLLMTGTQRVAANFTATWMSKPIYPPLVEGGPPDLRTEKRMEAAILLFDTATALATLGVLAHDAEDNGAATITRTVPTSTRARCPLRYLNGNARAGQYLHGTGLRLRLTLTGAIGSAGDLQALELQYVPRPGQTR